MTKFQKNILLLLIFLIILISACEVKVQKTVTAPRSAQAPEQQQNTAPQTNPQTSSPETKQTAAESDTSPQAKLSALNSVKCDGKTYNIAVKPKHSIIEISIPNNAEQKIIEIKNQGLIEEVVEVARNDGDVYLKESVSFGSNGKISSQILPGGVILIADIKSDSQETVYGKIKESSPNSNGISGLSINYQEQETILNYMCKVSVPKNTGSITLYSNIPEASFTVKGPAEYSGSGTCWTKLDAPTGEYTIIWNDISGYTAPGKFSQFASSSSQIKATLQGEGHLQLGGLYKADKEQTTGTLVVITNLPESTFTITGPASFSGSGICWAQSNVPVGQYEISFNDVAGYEIPFSFDKRKNVYVYAGNIGTASADYKKIGEES